MAYKDVGRTPPYSQDATQIEAASSGQDLFHIVNHIDPQYRCGIDQSVNHFFAVSATENNTFVNITSPELSRTVMLNRHDTFSEIAPDPQSELLGFTVKSSAPVTVVSGNLCTRNDGGSLAVGTYVSSQRSVSQYGTDYIVPGIKAPWNSGYDVQVVASQNATIVDVDGDVHVLNEGDVIAEKFSGRRTPTHVMCSLPCNVVQFTIGYQHYTGQFMISVLPPGDFYRKAVFTTYDVTEIIHITIVVDSPTPVDDLILDGESFAPEWIAYGDYTYATADVDRGYHVMTSVGSRFALYTYAHTERYSGGYGLAILPQ